MSDEVPETWIPPKSTNAGFLPTTGAHVRDGRLVQEVSRSVYVGAGLMCVLAVVALIPFAKWGIDFPYYVQVFISLGLVWGAFCAVVGGSWIQREMEASVVVDPVEQTVVIRRQEKKKVTIAIDQVIGLQILRGPKSHRAYELNLVFRADGGLISREVLVADGTRYLLMRVVRAYEQFTGWPILDATSRS